MKLARLLFSNIGKSKCTLHKRSSNFHKIKKVVEKHRLQAQKKILKKHKHLTKFLARHSTAITQNAARVATAGAVAGTLVFVPHVDKAKPVAAEAENKPLAPETAIKVPEVPVPKPIDVPAEVNAIIKEKETVSAAQEDQISSIISDAYRLKAKSTIDDHRLNVVYAKIGGEQHLRRFPGDSAGEHDTPNLPTGAGGMAPGNGAYGMWADSRSALTDQMKEGERFYIAAQTFLAPGFRDNPNDVYEFFRHRKVIVVNPKNGEACVAVVGDAGPASWTGKKFGGSPEVMAAVGLSTGPRKGPVLVYLVNDPDNKIPLGPIAPNGQAAPPLD